MQSPNHDHNKQGAKHNTFKHYLCDCVVTAHSSLQLRTIASREHTTVYLFTH